MRLNPLALLLSELIAIGVLLKSVLLDILSALWNSRLFRIVMILVVFIVVVIVLVNIIGLAYVAYIGGTVPTPEVIVPHFPVQRQ